MNYEDTLQEWSFSWNVQSYKETALVYFYTLSFVLFLVFDRCSRRHAWIEQW